MHDRAEAARIHAWDAGVTADSSLTDEFESRLRESSTLAVRVAYSVLRNREDAEDVAQEAFAKAYRSFSQLRDRDRFRAWLVRMTWRMALDRQRSNRRRVERETRAIQADLSASAKDYGGPAGAFREGGQVGLEARERAEHLWRAIDCLSEKLRIVIVLSGIQGHDVKAVSALLELPEGTVKSRLFAARQQLKEALSWMAPDQTR